MNTETHDSETERRIRDIYQQVPVPMEGIKQKLGGRTRRRRSLFSHTGEIGATIALTVALVAAGVIALPRFAQHPSTAAPIANQSSAPAATSSVWARPDCRLPVAIIEYQTTPGFLNVATGAFATVRGAGDAKGYAQQMGRWVPVYANQIAPGGAYYVYVASAGRGSALHLVDGSQDRVVASSSGTIQVVGFVPTGVAYVLWESSGLTEWVADQHTLQARLVASDRDYGWAGGGALWRVGPATVGHGTALYRLDLRTMTESVWLDVDKYLGGPAPSHPARMTSEGAAKTPEDHLHGDFGIIGFSDAGDPVVGLGSADVAGMSATLLVTGPQAVETIIRPGTNGAGHPVPVNATGGHSAVWMVDNSGHVFAYSSAGTLVNIAVIPLSTGEGAQLAGPCS